MPNRTRQEIVALAIPVVVSSCLQRITAIVDIVLVGSLGAAAIATVGVGQLLIFLVMTVAWGLSAGTSVVIAQLWGAQRRGDAAVVGSHSLVIGGLLGIGLGVAGISMSHAGAVFLGAQQDVLSLLGPYLRTIFWFIPCSLLINLISAIMHGAGDTRPPLRAAVLMNVVHIAVAFPLIHGVGGAPSHGVQGVAIATAVSETVGAVYLLTAGVTRRHLRAGRLRAGLMIEVIRIGIPVAGDRLLQQAGQLMYLKVVMLYGTTAYAAHQIGMAIEAISFLPGLGISMAATTAVGQRLGAQRVVEAAMAHREANRLALLIMAGMGTLFFGAPVTLLRVFTEDQALIALGTPLLKIVALLQIPLAITLVLSGSLRGAGDTPALFLSTVVGSWGIRVPLAWLFAVVFQFSLVAVWSLLLADWLGRMTVLGCRYRFSNWHQQCRIRTLSPNNGTLAAAASDESAVAACDVWSTGALAECSAENRAPSHHTE